MKKIVFLFALLGLWACQTGEKIPDVTDINVDVNLKRFEKDLFEMKTDGLENLQQQYPEFFPFYIFEMQQLAKRSMPDSTISNEILAFTQNPDIRTVYNDVLSTHPNTNDLEKELKSAFQFVKHYFPQTKVPEIVSFIAPFQYQAITIDLDLLGIGLDMHLGADYQFYPTAGQPQYLTQTFKPENAAVHGIKAYAKALLPENKRLNKMLDKMIYNGKILYFLDKVMPYTEGHQKIGYTPEQLQWCAENEIQIWAYFLEKNWLYETNSGKYMKYVNEGPTSPGMPPESPGNVGSWVGWQIVKQFAKNNPDVDLAELWTIEDGQQILKMSKYKPGN